MSGDNTLLDELDGKPADEDVSKETPGDESTDEVGGDIGGEPEPLANVVDDFVKGDLDSVRAAIKQQALKAVSREVFGAGDDGDPPGDLSTDDPSTDDA